jgi:UDP-N-acetylglucosamine acyltransferase
MSARIHPTAIVSPDATIAADAEIGPFAIVGEGCTIGAGCVIGPRATLERNVILAANVKVGTGTILGGDPQDLKFNGEYTTRSPSRPRWAGTASSCRMCTWRTTATSAMG